MSETLAQLFIVRLSPLLGFKEIVLQAMFKLAECITNLIQKYGRRSLTTLFLMLVVDHCSNST
jgi:hypothetical protein